MSSHPPSSATPQAPRASTFRTLLRLLPFVRPALSRIVFGMVAALLASVVALIIPLVLQRLVDGPLSSGDSRQIWPAFFVVIGLGVAEAVMIMARRWLVLKPSTFVEADLRNTLYKKLQDLPVAFHDRWQSGQLLSRSVSDLSLIRRWLAFGIVLLVVNFLTIAVGFVVLFFYSWVLGLIFLCASVPIWIVSLRFEKRYSTIARRSQDQVGDLATSVEESVHGIRVLKAFGRGKHSLRDFAKRAEDLRGTEIEKSKAIAQLWLWLLLVPDVAFALCLLAGIGLAANHQLSVGQLFAFFATATVLRFPVESIGFLLSMTFDTRTAVDRYFEVLDSVNTITEPENPKTIEDARGRLEFRATHFRYQDSPDRVRDLVDGVDLVLEPGETMALVGLTGSGKTTLLALVPRLYDVTGGEVLLDGVDVRDLSREELRRHVGMAFEDATLFSSSVRENVLLGRPGLEGDEAEAVLREALDIAQASFVDDLPEGVDTKVGEEGLSLSGGQRQRLALARAIAARPSILVLDDPLSALDVDTEARVEAGLRRVLASTTSLIVAHRPSTVNLADRVALLEDGRVTAVGTHSDLIATNEHYRYVISSLDDDDNDLHSREEVHA
ncbi:ABC transporter ATP-binding protein [Frondihabitans cladoniiphilus]|uniref:ABC transporter ATP-binding protein n=1 Tax=Frondihabitans cladoniiphilus TaxID=715785 RepID=A0ABP8VV37_9MICO